MLNFLNGTSVSLTAKKPADPNRVPLAPGFTYSVRAPPAPAKTKGQKVDIALEKFDDIARLYYCTKWDGSPYEEAAQDELWRRAEKFVKAMKKHNAKPRYPEEVKQEMKRVYHEAFDRTHDRTAAMRAMMGVSSRYFGQKYAGMTEEQKKQAKAAEARQKREEKRAELEPMRQRLREYNARRLSLKQDIVSRLQAASTLPERAQIMKTYRTNLKALGPRPAVRRTGRMDPGLSRHLTASKVAFGTTKGRPRIDYGSRLPYMSLGAKPERAVPAPLPPRALVSPQYTTTLPPPSASVMEAAREAAFRRTVAESDPAYDRRRRAFAREVGVLSQNKAMSQSLILTGIQETAKRNLVKYLKYVGYEQLPTRHRVD
ncbi:hypothetical protein PAPYR_12521 [Paratrimastix pyriformis]|uniref:Uncharacterized protein n=1 Tax=Paratrimastix pyriformis TaxID=342808 RepID=A0ABQ8U1R4_9EUKA|nr:hypothetical protein PAPYR_12521 [Paratrimastix pyriformis]